MSHLFFGFFLLFFRRNASVTSEICVIQFNTFLPPQFLNEESSYVSSRVTTIIYILLSFSIDSIGIIGSSSIFILSSPSCKHPASSSSSLLYSPCNSSSPGSLSSSPCGLYSRQKEAEQNKDTKKES